MATVAAQPALRLLLVEDSPADVELIINLLRRAGRDLAVFVVETRETFETELRQRPPDVILSDYRLPTFDGMAALDIAQREQPEIPFIFVTGALGEEVAIEMLKLGATDYVLKSNLSRLVPAVARALREAEQTREHEQAGIALQRSHDLLRALTKRLQSVREEERTRLAGELQQELGAGLAGVKLDLGWLAGHLAALPGSNVRLQRKLQAIAADLDTAIGRVARMAGELRPDLLDQHGLAAAIEWQASEFQTRTHIRCAVKAGGQTTPLTAECRTGCFRIFQASLNNILRHARATEIEIDLGEADHHLLLTVRDNGTAVSADAVADPRSVGLMGMKEQALQLGGEVTVAANPDRGTTVRVRLPLDPSRAPGPDADA